MASSSSSPPPSPCSSSRSAPLPSSTFASLPVMSLRDKIVEKIQQNRVTLIVGETGCGKSSQVPQFLLEENMAPILCTQPRRFAVVAVAKMVAKARNSELGGEVGYHIGHSKNFSEGSKIVFKTAGVLLDEMRDKGFNALKYKVIILDEVHERSVESDLVLVCVKQFLLKKKDLRVVLMSATADISRYKDYFRDLGRGERVEVLAIPSSTRKTVFQRSVSYLEQVAESLGISSEVVYSQYFPSSNPSAADVNLKPELHKLIHDMVLHIHEEEPDIQKSILVFLPTYNSLEKQWHLLKKLGSTFQVHILHSSIDIEQALMAMRISKSHRKVILATNIVESSVTIPEVAYVIDSCRSLQVFWDKYRKRDNTKLVWVSKSQAEQRRGRTGRTCDGQVYRLVTSSFFSKLEDHEDPAILKLSLRLQVLLICCADSKAINDPKALLQKALDPPDHQVIEDALDFLVHMHALEKTLPRGRYEPTFYGGLLASFPLSFDASVLVLKFGEIGRLNEGILLGIMMDMQPLPILHPFGDEDLFSSYIECYYNEKTILSGRKEIILMGNLCAFQFWQHVFKDKYRIEHLKQILKNEQIQAATELLPKFEEEWCSIHYLLPSSLRQMSEIYYEILHSIHQFRPNFLNKSEGPPSSDDPHGFKHTCRLACQSNDDTDVLAADGEGLDSSNESRKCVAVPYVASDHFHFIDVAKKFIAVIKEIRALYASVHQPESVDFDGFHVDGERPLCRFFINGYCSRGSNCLFSHSLQAKRPQCKFFFSLEGCRKGESCPFAHDMDRSVLSSMSYFSQPEDNGVNAASLINLFPTFSSKSILILDDTDLHFSSHLACHFDPSKIIVTTCLSETAIYKPSLTGVRILWGLHDTYQTILAKTGRNPIPWNKVECVLWFPNCDSFVDVDEQKHVFQNLFEYLAVRILADTLYQVKVIITMNNLRFSQLQVEKLARDSFFLLAKSFAFDETSFGKLNDEVTTKKPMLASRAISYVFGLYPPPTGSNLGNYAATLKKHLNNI
ncbi:hypothetical protein L6164_034693 [Bauhinia variegata]|uniref:Uncharacterized protein n=1 Tax=Bauhinia variegata TaxID=167791 RepID=A0ACB9KW74_BAUVA|nr:hypothetical protein L6164_034693 [Bauhinia variegata]